MIMKVRLVDTELPPSHGLKGWPKLAVDSPSVLAWWKAWKGREVEVGRPRAIQAEWTCGVAVLYPVLTEDMVQMLNPGVNLAPISVCEHWLQMGTMYNPAIDSSKKCMTDGSPVTADHREINPTTGQQKGYVALCPDERKKGFVRPVRRTYIHHTCGQPTTMALALAETYAVDPTFYSGTFCVHCRAHFPLDQFVWEGTEERVGS